MIMNSVELETLKLCAMGRFMPCSIAGKYDLPELRVSMLNFLVKKGYLKTVKGDEKCYRLSRRGGIYYIMRGIGILMIQDLVKKAQYLKDV